MTNWHQKAYTLNAPTPPLGNYAKVFKQEASNSFWLEPAVYLGPPTQVAQIAVSPGDLCYRVQFANGDMNEVWRGLYFFPAGHEPLSTQMGGDGNPVPLASTERLQANTTIEQRLSVISLYVDIAVLPPPAGFRVQVVKTGPGGGGGGWGGGHN
jgi:hypothetical protein